MFVREYGVVCVCAAFLALPTIGFASVIGFLEPEGSHEGRAIYVDGGFAGNVGDFLEIEEGEHRVSIVSSYGYRLLFSLRVGPNGNVVAHDYEPFRSECVDLDDRAPDLDFAYVLEDWSGGSVHRLAGSHVVLLDNPSYRYRGSPRTVCSVSPLRVLGPPTRVELAISSSPTGAGIFINGEDVGTTDARRVIPSYREERVHVALKLDGYSNCLHRIDLNGRRVEEEIHCEMVSIEADLRVLEETLARLERVRQR